MDGSIRTGRNGSRDGGTASTVTEAARARRIPVRPTAVRAPCRKPRTRPDTFTLVRGRREHPAESNVSSMSTQPAPISGQAEVKRPALPPGSVVGRQRRPPRPWVPQYTPPPPPPNEPGDTASAHLRGLQTTTGFPESLPPCQVRSLLLACCCTLGSFQHRRRLHGTSLVASKPHAQDAAVQAPVQEVRQFVLAQRQQELLDKVEEVRVGREEEVCDPILACCSHNQCNPMPHP